MGYTLVCICENLYMLMTSQPQEDERELKLLLEEPNLPSRFGSVESHYG